MAIWTFRPNLLRGLTQPGRIGRRSHPNRRPGGRADSGFTLIGAPRSDARDGLRQVRVIQGRTRSVRYLMGRRGLVWPQGGLAQPAEGAGTRL